MRSLCLTILSSLFLVSTLSSASAQVGAGNFDLSAYSVESVHGDWSVLCTVPGTGSREGDVRDCAVEDPLGFVMFVYPSGYYSMTIRDYGPGDQLLGRDLTESPDGIVTTYTSQVFAAEYIGRDAIRQDGEDRHLSTNGFAEAEARAVKMMRPVAL